MSHKYQVGDFVTVKNKYGLTDCKITMQLRDVEYQVYHEGSNLHDVIDQSNITGLTYADEKSTEFDISSHNHQYQVGDFVTVTTGLGIKDCKIVELLETDMYRVHHRETLVFFKIFECDITGFTCTKATSQDIDQSKKEQSGGTKSDSDIYEFNENQKYIKAIQAKSGGTKSDSGKPMVDLVDAQWLTEVAHVMTYGAKKPEYGPHNWRKGIVYSRIIAATLRHLLAIMMGKDIDLETGRLHAAHASCELMFLASFQLNNRTDLDDRYKGDK